MSYLLKKSIYANYLQINVEGTWPWESPANIIEEIFDLSREHKNLALLIDLRKMKSTPSVVSDYFEVEKFAAAGFSKIGFIAVLDILERKESSEFFETTASNRGMNFRFFYSDIDEAVSWLLSKTRKSK